MPGNAMAGATFQTLQATPYSDFDYGTFVNSATLSKLCDL